MRIARLLKLRSRRLLVAALLMLSGCGYSFGASGTNLPADAHSIYVARFTNQTRQTGVNDEFMVYLKDEIASHKRLVFVDNPRDADLQLTGEIVQVLSVPSTFNSILEPTQYNQTLVVRAWLRDTRIDKIIWSTAGMSDTERTPVVSQAVVNTSPSFLQQNLRSQDIRRMTDIQVAQTEQYNFRTQGMSNLAHHMYDSMASGF